MDKVIVLIAHGGNDLEVPCRLFPDMETGKKRCDEILGMEGEETKHGYRYEKDLEDEKEPWPISSELFTRFYYGCGGAYVFTLQEVPFDTKFVQWDLD
jgi:hypothetical protein